MVEEYKIIAAFDENCSICQKFARIVQFLSPKNSIYNTGARNPDNNLLQNVPLNLRLNELYVVSNATKTKKIELNSGFTAVQSIIGVTYLSFIISPCLALLQKLGLGAKLYRAIANSSFRNKCAAGRCSININIADKK